MKTITFFTALLVGLSAQAQLKVDLSVAAPAANCAKDLQGLIEGEQIRLSAQVSGAKGRVNYRFWHSNDGFQLNPSANRTGTTEVTEKTTRNNRADLTLPRLRDDIARLHVTFGVVVQDSKGNVGSAFKRMRVTRNLVFERDSQNPSPVCYEVKQPLLVSAQYVNQNDTDLNITISQSEQRIMESRSQRGSSWSFSPSLFVGNVFLSFFGYQRSHFRALADSLTESVYITVSGVLNPGDVGELYVQQTRFMVPMRVSQLNACREEVYSGQAFVDNFQRNYNLIKKDPESTDIGSLKNVGSPVVNTCASFENGLIKEEFYGR